MENINFHELVLLCLFKYFITSASIIPFGVCFAKKPARHIPHRCAKTRLTVQKFFHFKHFLGASSYQFGLVEIISGL
jgi:hypothetical protein